MHDLVHDLAQSMADNECINVSSCTTIIPDGIRHVSFINPPPFQFPKPLLKEKKLRTLLLSPLKNTIPRISTFRYLRVLEFSRHVSDEVPSSIGDLVHLRYLSLEGNYTNFIVRLLNLEYLKIQDLRELSKDFGKLINLRYLHLSKSRRLKSLPEKGISGLTSLRTLLIYECNELTSLPEGIQHLTKLRKLQITFCLNLVSLPSGMRYLTALEHLTIGFCDALEVSDEDFQGLRSLKFLYLEEIPRLVSLPKGLQHAAALEHLRICYCDALEVSDEDFQGLRSLKFLYLKFLPRLVSLPKGLQHAAATLTHMQIEECSRLKMLLESLSNFRLLQTLIIEDCPDLLYLPEGMQHLTALRSLSIVHCDHLTIRCRREVGEDWSKIAHVPHLDIRD